jgi:hypothetical protein
MTYKQSPIIPVRFQLDNIACHLLETGCRDLLLTMWVISCELDFDEEQKKSVILQGGLKLDYEILKSLKFTSQFNGEYYLENYNFEDINVCILDLAEMYLNTTYCQC